MINKHFAIHSEDQTWAEAGPSWSRSRSRSLLNVISRSRSRSLDSFQFRSRSRSRSHGAEADAEARLPTIEAAEAEAEAWTLKKPASWSRSRSRSRLRPMSGEDRMEALVNSRMLCLRSCWNHVNKMWNIYQYIIEQFTKKIVLLEKKSLPISASLQSGAQTGSAQPPHAINSLNAMPHLRCVNFCQVTFYVAKVSVACVSTWTVLIC